MYYIDNILYLQIEITVVKASYIQYLIILGDLKTNWFKMTKLITNI